MRQEDYAINTVRSFLKRKKAATLEELKSALDTEGTMTVFRKLKRLGYLSSYSHRGKYYTLRDVPEFDEQGLWSWHEVWFSKYGNLVETAKEFIEEAESGFTAAELQDILHVESKRALLRLYRARRVRREIAGGVQVYFSKETARYSRQSKRRKEQGARAGLEIETFSDELKAAIILFASLLDEQQRRLYAGLEAYKLGSSGDSRIGALIGVSARTVTRGREELFTGDVEKERVRRLGGGRIAVEKKRLK